MISISVKDRENKYYKDLVSLYDSAFPPEERFPAADLIELVKRGKAKAYAYEGELRNGETGFLGGSFLISNDTHVYILFLAIAEDARGLGHGTEMLRSFEEEFPGRTLTLCIESLRFDCDNMDERRRREAFYKRSGYDYVPMATDEPGGVFDMMAANGSATFEEMSDLFDEFIGQEFLGKWGMDLVEVER